MSVAGIGLSAFMLMTSGPAPPANTLEALGHALTACFQPPLGSGGAQITVVVTLKRDGSVFGKPRITFAQLTGSPDDKRAFVEAALGSLRMCTPVSVTSDLGGAIAGRPLAIRFVGGRPAQAI